MSAVKSIMTLRAREGELIDACEGLYDMAEKRGGGMTETEKRRDDELKAELLEVRAKIATADAHAARIRMAPSANTAPGSGVAPVTPEDLPARQFAARSDRTGRLYRELFGTPQASEHFRSVGPFLEAVASGRHHPGLVAASMVEGAGSSGGFLVPEEHSAEQLDAALEEEVVRPRARVYGMVGDTRKVAGFEASGSATTGPFGFVPSWTAEGATIATVDPLIRMIELKAKKLGLIVQASNELVADGLSYAAQLEGVLRSAIAWSLDHAFLNGTGAGQPLGVLNAACTIVVSKETGQAADTFIAANALKMYSRLLPGSFRSAVWVVNATTIPQLYTLNIPIGTGGALLPYFQVGPDGRMTLLGLPIVQTEKLPELGDQGDVLLADFTFFGVGLRKEIALDRSAHAGFSQDLETFRGTLRADGQPLLNKAYTPKVGQSKSAFVVLAARA